MFFYVLVDFSKYEEAAIFSMSPLETPQQSQPSFQSKSSEGLLT